MIAVKPATGDGDNRVLSDGFGAPDGSDEDCHQTARLGQLADQRAQVHASGVNAAS